MPSRPDLAVCRAAARTIVTEWPHCERRPSADVYASAVYSITCWTGFVSGESAVLVIRGEAGVGKTALLRYCARQAAGCRARSDRRRRVRAGVAVRGSAPAVPSDARRHRRAARAPGRGLAGRLRTDDRYGSGSVPGRAGRAEPARRGRRGSAPGVSCRRLPVAGCRFRTGPGVRGPIGCWPNPCVLLFAVREAGEERMFPALPALNVEGLTDSDARRRSWPPQSPVMLDERVGDRVVAETGGNPVGAPGTGPRDERHRTERRLRRPVHGKPFPVICTSTTYSRAGPPAADAAADAVGCRRPHRGCHAPLASRPRARRRTA